VKEDKVMSKEYHHLINTKHFELDLTFNPWCISFAFSIGVNSFIGKKPTNLFLEFEFMFWCLSTEFKNYRRI